MQLKKHLKRAPSHRFNPIDTPYLRAPEGGDDGGGGGGSGGDDGGGGGDDPPPTTYDQKQLASIVAKERKTERARMEKQYSSQLAEEKQAREALAAELEELRQANELAGKGDKEKELITAQNELTKLQKAREREAQEREQLQRERDELFSERRRRTMQDRLLPSLVKAGVSESEKARRQALDLMISGGAEIDDDGELTVTVGDRQYTDLEQAAAAFLEENDHFAKAPASGPSPTGRPNGAPSPKDLESMSPSQLISGGLRQRAQRR